MKKVVLISIAIVVVALVVLGMILVWFQPVRDTFDISDEERELLQAPNDTEVLRLFYIDAVKAFADYDNIHDIIKKGGAEVYYQINSDEGLFGYILKSNDYSTEFETFERDWSDWDMEDVNKYLKYLSEFFGEEVELIGAYFLMDSDCVDQTRPSGWLNMPAICLKTNKGEYVAYNFWIMSVEAFHKYCQCRQITPTQYPSDAYNWDMSVYSYGSKKFNPNAPGPQLPPDKEEVLLMVGAIGSAVLLVVGTPVIVFAIKRKKKKAALSVNAEPTTEQTE